MHCETKMNRQGTSQSPQTPRHALLFNSWPKVHIGSCCILNITGMFCCGTNFSICGPFTGWHLWQRCRITSLYLKTPVYCYHWFKKTPQTHKSTDKGLWGSEMALRKLPFHLKQMAWKGSLSPLAGRTRVQWIAPKCAATSITDLELSIRTFFKQLILRFSEWFLSWGFFSFIFFFSLDIFCMVWFSCIN